MRHFTRDRSPFRVRLACVKHAASVQSEPESNSPVQICSKDLRWTEIRISKFLPVRYSLVNEPHRFTRREAVVYAASFSLSTSFFIFAKVFFRGPVGATRWRKRDSCLIFKPASRTFLPSGKISFPAALSDVAGSLARTALCAFSTPPSSIFPQKILWIYSPLTDYSINIPKRHRKMFAFFSSNRLPLPQKLRYRQRRNGALAMHPPFCLSARLLYSATKTPAEPPDSYLFQPIDGGELSMTAFQVIAFFLRRGTSRTPVSDCPASAIKKPGKVSPSRPAMADVPNPPRSGCCPRANFGHRPRHSSA